MSKIVILIQIRSHNQEIKNKYWFIIIRKIDHSSLRDKINILVKRKHFGLPVRNRIDGTQLIKAGQVDLLGAKLQKISKTNVILIEFLANKYV